MFDTKFLASCAFFERKFILSTTVFLIFSKVPKIYVEIAPTISDIETFIDSQNQDSFGQTVSQFFTT